MTRDQARAFGRALKKLLDSARLYRLPIEGDTWTAGRCWVLAQALAGWMGPGASLWSVHAHNADLRTAQHVVVRYGDWLFDGDGASTEQELHAADIVCPADRIPLLRRELDRGLGKPERWGFGTPTGGVIWRPRV